MFARGLLTAAASIASASAKTALLVVDVQDCFLEANTTSGQQGSLSVPASHIIASINDMMKEKACLFDEVVYTQDFHPVNHISFASTHGLAPFAHLGGKGSLPLMCIRPSSGLTQDAACCPTVYVNSSLVNCTTQLCPPDSWNYDVNNTGIITNNLACTQCANDPSSCYATTQEMWTDHCLQTGDSTFPPGLNMGSNPKIVQKGGNQFVDAYSGFMDNTGSVKTQLDSELKAMGITEVFVVGIATDVCVKWSVRDALAESYEVTLVKDATAAVLGSQPNFDAAVSFMGTEGATVKTVAEVLAMQCPTTTTAPTNMFPTITATTTDSFEASSSPRVQSTMLTMVSLLVWAALAAK